MSQAIRQAASSPRPGTAAAFKQRHEAYQLTATIKERLSAALDALEDGWPSQAVRTLQWPVEAIARNPEAERMIEARHPGAIREARTMLNEAAREAQSEPKIIQRGDWRQDYGMESKLNIGQSKEGYHYIVFVSRQSWENDPQWSKPFPTQKAAEGAGYGAQAAAHGDGRYRPEVTTSRSQHARKLDAAANLRRAAAQADPDWKASHVSQAKQQVRVARIARQAGLSMQQSVGMNRGR